MARDPDREMVEVEVRPGKIFHTILKQNKATRTATDHPPGSRLQVSLRAARAFSDRLLIVGRPVPTEDQGPSEVLEDRAGAMEEFSATEAAAKFAAEIGVDMAGVKGTGAGGRILLKDVKAAAA